MKPGLAAEENLSRSYEQPAIRPEMTVRQVATDYPPCRDIFVAYGEPIDRPGRFGHFQPLAQFARTRGVDLEQLLDRLSRAAGVPIDRAGNAAERMYRPFLVAALAITLTLGAGWGGWLLWDIGIRSDFNAASTAHVVAHGEAQLWGFIGLFIVGVSLRTVLMPAVRTRRDQRLCAGLLAMALASFAAGFAWSLWPTTMPWLGWASAAALVGLSLTFWCVQIRSVWPKRQTTWARAVMISGMWLTLWAGVTWQLRWQVAEAGPGSFSSADRLLLIELAVFGFAMNSIYGFGQMLLPGFLRTGQTRTWAIEAAFWLHNLGVAGCVAASFGAVPSSLAALGILAIAAGAILYGIGQHVFLGKPRTSQRPEQGHRHLDCYIPLAFLWLILSMLLLVAAQLYEFAAHASPPHAYMGAVRHALTVGFMTTLILGVAQRVVPVFEHRVLIWPGLVLPILVLILLGNSVRVATELATIRVPWAYMVMPASALLEWTALLLFTLSICAVMWQTDPFLKTGRVTEQSSLAVLLAEKPWMEDRLTEKGSYLARARTVPRELTIGSFARSEGQSPETLVAELNRLLQDAQRSGSAEQLSID